MTEENELTWTASLFMPMFRHFWYRQYWHLFLCLLSMVQLLSSLQAYVKSFRTVLLKNPLHPSQLWKNTKINQYPWNRKVKKLFLRLSSTKPSVAIWETLKAILKLKMSRFTTKNLLFELLYSCRYILYSFINAILETFKIIPQKLAQINHSKKLSCGHDEKWASNYTWKDWKNYNDVKIL